MHKILFKLYCLVHDKSKLSTLPLLMQASASVTRGLFEIIEANKRRGKWQASVSNVDEFLTKLSDFPFIFCKLDSCDNSIFGIVAV